MFHQSFKFAVNIFGSHFLGLKVADLGVYISQILHFVLIFLKFLPVIAEEHIFSFLFDQKELEPVFNVPLNPKMLW